jgi:uncharacterized protein (DUF58 family)
MAVPAAPAAPSASASPSASPEALLQQIEWTVLRRLDGLLQGDYRTLWRGAGLDLADLREYQLHDDVRHIDWNVTARLQQPHVRQFTEDRELTAWFLLDLTGSVDFGSDGRTKLAVAEGFTAALARLLTRQGNRVGALTLNPGALTADTVLPAGAGRTQVLRLLSLLRAAPGPGSAAAPAGPTQLATLLQRAEALIRRRSMVFVVSDFISEPGWQAALGRLARRHEVLTVRLYDPLEMALPDAGTLVLQDAETGEQLTVDTQDADFRARHAALAQQHEAALRDALAQAGVDTLELATGDDLLASLLRLVALRRQRLRLPAARALAAAA